MNEPNTPSGVYQSTERFGAQLQGAIRRHPNARSPRSRKVWLAGCAAFLVAAGGGGVAIAEIFDDPAAPAPLVTDGDLSGEFVYQGNEFGGSCAGDRYVMDMAGGAVTVECSDGTDPGMSAEEITAAETVLREQLQQAGAPSSSR